MRPVLFCVAVACAAGLPVFAGAAGAQAPVFPQLTAAAPVADGAVEPCGPSSGHGQIHCGVFRLDEDNRPGGRTIDLNFVIFRATESDARNSSPVVPFSGGPGASTIPSSWDLQGALQELRRSRDLLFIDLRGTGRSNGLNCGMPYPDGIESRFGTLFPLSHVEQCRVALASRADLRHYTTPKSVDDIEALRRWLGYSGVNLYGGSYGTRVAQVYMRRHPDAVRTAVLNGVTPVSEPVYVHAASSIQNALDVLIAECEAKPACHSTHPGFRAAVAALVERIAEGEVEVTLDGRTLPFSAGDLSYALRGLLYQRASEIPDLVDRAANGDLRELASYYLERTAWVRDDFIASGNHFSVLCAEDIERLTDEDVERATDGLWIRDHLVRSYREACAVWPNAELPPSYFRPVASDVPTLLYL